MFEPFNSCIEDSRCCSSILAKTRLLTNIHPWAVFQELCEEIKWLKSLLSTKSPSTEETVPVSLCMIHLLSCQLSSCCWGWVWFYSVSALGGIRSFNSCCTTEWFTCCASACFVAAFEADKGEARPEATTLEGNRSWTSWGVGNSYDDRLQNSFVGVICALVTLF